MFSSLRRLDTVFGGRRSRSPRRRAGNRPLRVEPLEDRKLLTIDLVSGVTDPTLLGAAAGGPSEMERFAASADGRYVAFGSAATNLVSGDTNGHADVFVKDMRSGVILIASTDSAGKQANAESDQASLSGDGRYVAFRSTANNLVSDDSLSYSDVFVKDLRTGVTTRISTDSAGGEAHNNSDSPAISSDGRYVAFRSSADNLVANDGSAGAQVFVKDLQTGATRRVSIDSTGAGANRESSYPAMSADGRYVVFQTEASNLVADDSNGYADIFMKDLQTGFVERVSTDSADQEGNSDSEYASISSDGRYVAFCSHASDLLPDANNNGKRDDDANGLCDVFVKDRQTGATRLLSTDSTGTGQANADSNYAMITGDGKSVLFCSAADNLTSGDTNSHADIFSKNLQTGSVTRVSQNADQEADGDSDCSWASNDGRYVVYCSGAGNLVSGDTNGSSDIFRKDMQSGAMELVSARDQYILPPFTAGGLSDSTVVSGDGRYVAFRSYANNLVADDTNSLADIFRKDLQTGEVRLVSTGLKDAPANRESEWPSISRDGRYVAFRSCATNLVEKDSNGVADIFVKDFETGLIRRVNTDSVGNPASGGDSDYPAISADGQHVAFQSYAANLVSNDTNGFSDVFVKDLETNITTRASTDTDGAQFRSASSQPSISSDGRYVAFQEVDRLQILVKDTLTDTTTRASTSAGGEAANGDCYWPSISDDGRVVAFAGDATNLTAGDNNGYADVFAKDLVTGTVTLASADSSGAPASSWSRAPALSGDGRFVTFVSYASDLPHSDTNALYDVVVKDLQTGQVGLVCAGGEGVEQSNGHAYAPAISRYGTFVTFACAASNLVAGDGNDSYDVFRGTNPVGNAASTEILLDNDTIAENSDPGTFIGALDTSDINPGDVFTYTLVNNAGGRFKLDGNRLLVADSWLMNYDEAVANQGIRVRSTDQLHQSIETDLTINITNLHDFASPGLFDPSHSTFFLRKSNDTGFADYTFGYGEPNAAWKVLVGDWNGDGRTGVGLYDPEKSIFYLTDAYTTGYAEYAFTFGTPGKNLIPLVGDWNGDGTSGVGYYDPKTATFRLTDTLAPLAESYTFVAGTPDGGWTPLVGDWNGDGASGVGLYDPKTSYFHLINSLNQGFVQYTFGYGEPNAGWQPLVGDWDRDRSSGVGLYNPHASTFYLRNDLTMGFADYTFGYGEPNAGWQPLVGDWNGDNQSGIGLYDPSGSTFYLTNRLTSGYAESTLGFGEPGAKWQPVIGCWITAADQQAELTAPQPAPAVDQIDLAAVAAHELQRLRSSSLDDSDDLDDALL